MARKKSSSKAGLGAIKVRGRAKEKVVRRNLSPRKVAGIAVPAIVLSVLVAAILFMALSGYETATASAFFGLRNVDVRGTDRTAPDEVVKLVKSSVEKPGVWNADLAEIRLKIEKFPFVKSAAVARTLPAGIRVDITERIPAAIVQLNAGKYLFDVDGTMLVAVKEPEKDFPIVLKGWDETKTEKAIPENLGRLRIYRKMLDEARQFDVAKRIKEFNLQNAREPIAVVEDSGNIIGVTLARDNLGKSLKAALDALTGKGARVKSVDAAGVFPLLRYKEF